MKFSSEKGGRKQGTMDYREFFTGCIERLPGVIALIILNLRTNSGGPWEMYESRVTYLST